MTTPIGIAITNAGIAALTAANGTYPIVIASMALTATPFVLSPTMVAVPGAFKTISAVGGGAVDDATIHLVALDNSSDAYTVTGFGLLLDDGTLFAAYTQADPLVAKVAASTLWFAHDIVLSNGNAGSISFGPANFTNPPAGTDLAGIIEIATQAEVDAGLDEQRAVTPKTLAARIEGVIPLTRNISTAGLATGGGSLEADRTITVAAANNAEAIAGTVTTKAMTPASTKAALDAAIAAVVNGAPGALDQLSELAAAMGNDPNFATTMINQLAGKAALAGAAFTGNISAPQIVTTSQGLGRNVWIGDDAWLGDCNLDNTVSVMGQQDATSGYFKFGSNANRLGVTAGGPLRWGTNVIWHAGNMGSGGGLDADKLDGQEGAWYADIPARLGYTPAASGRSIATTGLATGGGNMSADRTITVQAASAGDVSAGTATDRAVTPASLAGRTIATSGLATGGGNLAADRTISVVAASGADVAAGTATDRAVTPAALAGLAKNLSPNGYCTLPGGLIIQWVQHRTTYTYEAVVPITFPVAFPNAALAVSLTGYTELPSNVRDLWPQLQNGAIATGCSVQLQSDDSDDSRVDGFDLIVLGY
jgi:hypothetical protein